MGIDAVGKLITELPPLAAREQYLPDLYAAWQPPPRMTVSAWADEHRILTTVDSPEPGQWDTNKAPFQRGMMDAIGDDETEMVVLKLASQTGKTNLILNCIGRAMDLDPGPMLFVSPTVTMSEKISRQRVSPMVANCPVLRNKVRRGEHGAFNGASDSVLLKVFPGGMLIMAGAATPDSLSSFPMRYLYADEVDTWRDDAGGQGDPFELALTRTVNFWNRKIVAAGTPTIKGSSRVASLYEASSRGLYEMPCPRCHHHQFVRWGQVDYSGAYGGTLLKPLAFCVQCERASSQAQWQGNPGRWVHVDPTNRVKGFHANALVSPWQKWPDLVKKWVKASEHAKQGNDYYRMVFINTRLAEEWEPRSVKVEQDILFERREVYPAAVPDGVITITAGADVQYVQKRIQFEIVGWGAGGESWGLEYGTILADPYEDECWQQFDERLYQWIGLDAAGNRFRVRHTFVDANGAIAPYVYEYTRKRQPRIFSSRGDSNKIRAANFVIKRNVDKRVGATYFILNTEMAKEEMLTRLLIGRPGPGYCHYPQSPDGAPLLGYDETYFSGLTSESKVERLNKSGYKVREWRKDNTRAENEPVDCRVYARCALELAEKAVSLDAGEPDYFELAAKNGQKTGQNAAGNRPMGAQKWPAAGAFSPQNRPIAAQNAAQLGGFRGHVQQKEANIY